MWSLQLASFIQDVFEVQPFCSMHCLLFFFNVGHFKVFIEFITILFYILVLGPQGMWHLRSHTKDQTSSPCTGRHSLYHWPAREVPDLIDPDWERLKVGERDDRGRDGWMASATQST